MNLLCRVFLAAAFIAAANLAANEPKDFSAMTLNLSDRQLSSVPEELLFQNDLEELWLDSNQIRELPEAIAGLMRCRQKVGQKNEGNK